ncbi:hypothetical protein SARC_06857 [Sphaeroforma arctica JP610]|uniref:uracil phosphoribosyltransferase n=1 Tax=Sphaeroforma arctica JP610 TaxID=667725 RepID=A0A0L0FVW8_9EUKA|nr:hypothetical protein SARC_06857 [Sphaeroforma arctica JP610]KNC80794.1 hypothetical protein SARC_06857 [Sphaeroforma arctica JP610]|eukprot:XP_014154696.1 hypothetical protein SARC_06857 [Sphaeroforma arctica JP610]
MRAGEAMEDGFRDCCRNVRIGKILVQKDPRDANSERKIYYAKFPKDMHERHVFVLDPLVATGMSVCKAIEVLLDYKVEQSRIIFLTLFAAPEGLKLLHETYPDITIVTTHVDEGVDSEGFIVPGLGDFGDRFFSTEFTI